MAATYLVKLNGGSCGSEGVTDGDGRERGIMDKGCPQASRNGASSPLYTLIRDDGVPHRLPLISWSQSSYGRANSTPRPRLIPEGRGPRPRRSKVRHAAQELDHPERGSGRRSEVLGGSESSSLVYDLSHPTSNPPGGSGHVALLFWCLCSFNGGSMLCGSYSGSSSASLSPPFESISGDVSGLRSVTDQVLQYNTEVLQYSTWTARYPTLPQSLFAFSPTRAADSPFWNDGTPTRRAPHHAVQQQQQQSSQTANGSLECGGGQTVGLPSAR